MRASHRICETCVYCSFVGNCDRYNKPLTSIEQPACDAYEIHPLLAENAKLREQTERLVTLLRNDCDIEASWDGLRRFWNIGLTESGCLMRDRACKAEAENAKLRELVRDMAAEIRGLGVDFKRVGWCDYADRMRELGVEV